MSRQPHSINKRVGRFHVNVYSDTYSCSIQDYRRGSKEVEFFHLSLSDLRDLQYCVSEAIRTAEAMGEV